MKKNRKPQQNIPESLFSAEMIKQFADEAIELLNTAESDLLALEKKPESRELIDSSFRSIHSLKGNAGYLEFTDIIEVCHRAETFLDNVREGRIKIKSQKITILLQVVDSLRTAVNNLFDNRPPLVAGKISLINLMDENFNNADEDKNEKEINVSAEDNQNESEFNGKKDDDFIRVKVDKLNRLMDLVGEIVISESMVSQHPQLTDLDNPDFEKSIRNHQKNIRELQEIATSMRMIPLSRLFNRLNRVVRDIADKENKKVQLNISGGETEVDRSVIENISDPLVHILRNAIDHGIEGQRERVNKGKSKTGQVNINARRVAGEIWIEIEDDGTGLDNEAIVKKAMEKGLIAETEAELSPQKIWSFIFTSGLSTAKQITDISGRGVGMDIVARNLEKIRGRIDVQSSRGLGTKFTIKIPLTTAIVDGTLMRVNNSLYAIPTQDIKESVHISESNMISLVNGYEVLKIRDKIIPILRLQKLHHLDHDGQKTEDGIVVIAENIGKNVGFFMDEIIGLQQLVIKPLSNYTGNIMGVSGCAVLGNGEICLILDMATLIKRTNLNQN